MTLWESVFLCFLIAINLGAFIMMFRDKRIAVKNESRSQKDKKKRMPEATLILWALCLGFLGIWLGMYFPSRHKTNKPKFYIGIPIIAIGETLLLGWLYHTMTQ